MGTLLFDEIKKKTSGFLQEKYKVARLALTDVTEAEMLAEEATNSDPRSPDARTMNRIADASFDIDDYWRIVEVIHKRLNVVDWKEWRKSYKALALLDFLLTHGPEAFAEEFQCDVDVIEELGAFKYIDDKGFNWGANMEKKSERVLKLLKWKDFLKFARLKALKISKEIKGFGNLMASPVSTSSPSSSGTSRTSFGSYSVTSSMWNEPEDYLGKREQNHPRKSHMENCSPTILSSEEGSHLWDNPIQEAGCLLDQDDEQDEEKMNNSYIWDNENVVMRSFSDVGKEIKKKLHRQFSTRY
ncbi:hypothetical protein MKW94_005646 [Papaver nudicaule]|uniref:ENTH domain-containing protein n=1 Tax=Papaver nudicaule TaxID=74823 RepID=A0AA41VZI2_PAPNU|nr:hypothetical protein [Papaver nudicaule]